MICFTQVVSAQQSIRHQADTLELASMTASYYESVSFLDRNYDYELANRKHNLEMWASGMESIAILTMASASVLGGYLCSKYEWKEAVYIPSMVVLEMSVIVPMLFLRKNLMEEAASIELGPTVFGGPDGANGIGIGLRQRF